MNKAFTPTPNRHWLRQLAAMRPVPVMVWGFTLIELLVVIAIIGILASVVVVNFATGAREARDAKRVQELYQIGHALQIYYSEKGVYPDNTDTDAACNLHGIAWDAGNLALGADDFVKPLIDEKALSSTPREWTDIKDPSGSSCVYRYAKVENPCGCSGTYAILYGACETDSCPIGERPACCTDVAWFEAGVGYDEYDVAIFLKQGQ